MSQPKNKYLSNFIETCRERYSVDRKDMTMGEWICENTTLGGRKFNFQRYPFQEEIASDMHNRVAVIKCSQIGLALSLDTPINTPKGWCSLGQLQVGDQVYDDKGKVCNITYVSPIYQNRTCYEVEFDDGEKIIADGEHRWYVDGYRAFHEWEGLWGKTGRPLDSLGYTKQGIIRTVTLFNSYKLGKRNVFSIPTTPPLKGVDRGITLDPYFLGYWLGDGSRSASHISGEESDLQELKTYLEEAGLVGRIIPGHDGRCATLKVENKKNNRYHSVHYQLTQLGVREKHVPRNYLKGSVETRLKVLQGLMDSDGSVTKKGRCSFYNTNETLINNFRELAHSLGYKTRLRWKKPSRGILKNGEQINSQRMIGEVSFISYKDFPAFRLSRKVSRLRTDQAGKPKEVGRRYIVTVKKVETVPVRCISVDSPSHLYLAGAAMVATHNTEIQIRKTLGYLYRNPHKQGLYSLPNKNLRDVNSKTRIAPILEKDAIFNRLTGKKPIRSTPMYEVDRSFLHVLNASESAATSISLDMLMIDEVDLTEESVLALYSSRLQNSDVNIRHDFSTPSFDDYGIDVSYQNSDQREYLLKCECCNHWQAPTWDRKFLNIPGLEESVELDEITKDIIPTLDLINSEVICEKCAMPLNLAGQREWVAQKPGMSQISHGYRVGPFSTNRLGIPYILTQLLEYQKRDYLRGFYNTVLGKTYRDAKTRLAEVDIKQNLQNPEVPEIYSTDAYIVGIDVGALCHVVLGRIRNVDDIEIVKLDVVSSGYLETYVKQLCIDYNIVGGAVDKMPYTPTAQAVFEISGRKIFPVEYWNSDNYKLRENEEMPSENYFSLNRTWILDKVAKYIRDKRLPINGYKQHEKSYVSHLQSMVRDEKPETPAVWIKLNREDHFFHATGYLIAAAYFVELIRAHGKTSDIREVCATMIATAPTSSDMLTTRQRYGNRTGASGHIVTTTVIG